MVIARSVGFTLGGNRVLKGGNRGKKCCFPRSFVMQTSGETEARIFYEKSYKVRGKPKFVHQLSTVASYNYQMNFIRIEINLCTIYCKVTTHITHINNHTQCSLHVLHE